MSEPVQVNPVEIKAGRVYHFRDSQEKSVYDWAKEKDRIPFTITRIAPEEVDSAYGPHDKIWLSTRTDVEDVETTIDLSRIKRKIDDRISKGNKLVVFGKGSVDYLIDNSDTKTMSIYLQRIADVVSGTDNIVAAELNLKDADLKSAYQRLIRTAPFYEWPISSAEEYTDEQFKKDTDELLEKKAKLSEKRDSKFPFITGDWPGEKK